MAPPYDDSIYYCSKLYQNKAQMTVFLTGSYYNIIIIIVNVILCTAENLT